MELVNSLPQWQWELCSWHLSSRSVRSEFQDTVVLRQMAFKANIHVLLNLRPPHVVRMPQNPLTFLMLSSATETNTNVF